MVPTHSLPGVLAILSLLFATHSLAASNAAGLRLAKVATDKVYFTYNEEPLLSFGGGSDFIFYAAPDAYDYQRWADWAAQHGINHIRAYPPLSWKHIEKLTQENGGSLSNVLFPYLQTQPGSRQFDLTQFNQAYWERFRRQCQYLESKGIIIHLLMWNGWQLRDNGLDWQGHFFNPQNNINSFTNPLGGDPANRLKLYHCVVDRNRGLVKAQEAWFRKLIEVTHDLGNVYYDLVHEIAEHRGSWPETQAWIDAMAQQVRSRWAELVSNRPIILGMDAGGLAGFPRTSARRGEIPRAGSPVDWIFTRPYFDVLIYGKVHHVTNAKQWRKRYKKPYIPQESWDDNSIKWSYRVPAHRVHARKYFWKFMMAKCQQMDLYYKPRDRADNPPGAAHNYDPRGWSEFEEDALVLREFWDSFVDYPDLWFQGEVQSGPGDHQYVLSSKREAVAYCSSESGEKHVLYESRNLELRGLALADADYQVEVVRPSVGAVETRTVSVKNGAVDIPLPSFTDDIAVHFRGVRP
ncbi:hypothetical protein MYX78_05830 [Acidobacteria bacterium AH-259-G07]|nr:hypothetical protein [Acidobacteria bacterium AH-259-G07]